MKRWVALLPGLAAATFVVATVVEAARRLFPTCGLDHNVGVYLSLAELARRGIVYPHEQTPELLYATLYQPLGFLPYALLPGSGFTLIPAMRALVRAEVLAALVGMVLLLRRGGAGWPARWSALVLALCATPVCAALLSCIDDPRGALVAMLAFGAFTAGGRCHPGWAAPLFALAFFTKLTAPGAALVAALVAAWQARDRRAALALLWLSAAWTAAGYALAHGVLGWDLAGNGLRYALVDAKPGRPLGLHAALYWRDLVREPIAALLLIGGALGALVRLRRGQADALDAWLAAALLRAFVEYRSHGTELNHLFEPCLLGAVAVVRAVGPWLRRWHLLVLLPAAIWLGRPLLSVPLGDPAPLSQSPEAVAASALRAAQPPALTLCENPLLAWTAFWEEESKADDAGEPDRRPARQRALVVDPFLAAPVLRRWPGIRATWFADPARPGALQRLVLIADPDRAGADRWYGDLHFDARFLADVRRSFSVVGATPYGTVLVRR